MTRLESFLLWLKAQAQLRYASRPERSVTYEDIAYLAAQIYDDLRDEYDNPALGPLICCARNALFDLWACDDKEGTTLANLSEETSNYIDDVVAMMLQKKPARWDHFQLILDAINDSRFNEVNLFTLNHDTLLETFLRSKGITVVDGFDREDSLGIRRWNPDLFDCWQIHMTGPTVRLFKLHGSIDWCRFRPTEDHKNEPVLNPWRDEYVGIRSNPKLAQATDERGRKHREMDRARFLTGTFNKMLSYANRIFLELHYRFHRILSDSERLVICGYGLGDKGINNRLADWMVLPPDIAKRKLVLIDPRALEDILHSSRGAAGDKLPVLNADGRLAFIGLPLGSPDLTWESITTPWWTTDTNLKE